MQSVLEISPAEAKNRLSASNKTALIDVREPEECALAHLESIVNDCRQKEIDLTAAGTTVPPLDPSSVAKLQSLAASIDVATVRNAVVTAALSGLASILNSAVRIKAMV